MGCPVRATMDVVQVGEALGLPVWLDRYAAEADWIGLVNRVKPHTDFKGSIESGLFKMMTIGLGKWKGAVQYHRANVNHGYETVITAVGREMLAKARIGFGLGIVENGYDETAHIEAFNAADLEAGERRLLEERARVDGAAAVLADRRAHRRADRQEHLGLRHGHQRHRPADQPLRAVPDRSQDHSGSSRSTSPRRATATPPGIGNADFTTRRLVDKIDMKATLINCITACAPGGAKIPATFETDREADRDRARLHRAHAARAGARHPHQEHADARRDRGLGGLRRRGGQARRPDRARRGARSASTRPGASFPSNRVLPHRRGSTPCLDSRSLTVAAGRARRRRVARSAPASAQQKTTLVFSAGPTGGTLDADGGGHRGGDQEEVPRARRAGGAGRRARQHGEDAQRQGRPGLVDDDRPGRRPGRHQLLEGQGDRQGALRRQLLPERLAARGARRQRRRRPSRTSRARRSRCRRAATPAWPRAGSGC